MVFNELPETVRDREKFEQAFLAVTRLVESERDQPEEAAPEEKYFERGGKEYSLAKPGRDPSTARDDLIRPPSGVNRCSVVHILREAARNVTSERAVLEAVNQRPRLSDSASRVFLGTQRCQGNASVSPEKPEA